MSTSKKSAVDQYRETYSGRELLKKYSLDTYGTWRVRGEDPNCDLGGHHYQPELGTFEGKLGDIIEYAVGLPQFWTWGGGGNFELMKKPLKIDGDSVRKRAEAAERKKALLAELEQLNTFLGEK